MFVFGVFWFLWAVGFVQGKESKRQNNNNKRKKWEKCNKHKSFALKRRDEAEIETDIEVCLWKVEGRNEQVRSLSLPLSVCMACMFMRSKYMIYATVRKGIVTRNCYDISIWKDFEGCRDIHSGQCSIIISTGHLSTAEIQDKPR